MSDKSWLGFDRYQRDDFGRESDLGLDGRLRGIRTIDWGRLNRARELLTYKVADGCYLVVEPEVLAAWPEDMPLYEWLNQPVFCRRGGQEDLDGWNCYWVNLADPEVEPCYCRDMYIHGDEGVACKHLLAALIAEGHPYILKKVEELETREQIASVLKKEITAA